MRFSHLLVALALASGSLLARPAQAQTNPANYSYQQVTTIESVVGGGFGRSKMLFTPAYKGAADAPLENLFSLTGINMSQHSEKRGNHPADVSGDERRRF